MSLYKVRDAGGASIASLLGGRRRIAKPAQKAELQQWESEGGTVTPAPGVADTLARTARTGSA